MRITRRELKRLVESMLAEELKDYDPGTPGIQAKESDLDPGAATVPTAGKYADLAQATAKEEAQKVSRALINAAGGKVAVAKLEYFGGNKGLVTVIDDDAGPAYHLVSGDSSDSGWENEIKENDYRKLTGEEKSALSKIGYSQYFYGVGKLVEIEEAGIQAQFILLPLKD
jgi:hypothetical protein